MASNQEIARLVRRQKEAPNLADRKVAGKRLQNIMNQRDLMKAKARHQSKNG